MKGKTSFFIKGMYLILVIIIISIVINEVVSLNVERSKSQKENELKEKSMNILEILVGSTKCLAYEESGKFEGKSIGLASHSIIDVEKMKKITKDYANLEPDCARDFEFGYKVRVETLPINISTHGIERSGGVFGKIFELVDGKKTVFVLDTSGSMDQDAGLCNVDTAFPNSKICCLKRFMYGFIDKLKPGSAIAVIAYGYNSKYYDWLITPFTILNGDRTSLKTQISPLIPEDSTPMCKGLEAAYDFAIDNGGEVIVLLTDGSENFGGCGNPNCGENPPGSIEVAEKYKDSGIPVHTIGFGKSGVCYPALEGVAKISNGEFFPAQTCEELISEAKEVLNVTMPREVWEFGNSVFSKDKSIESSVKISIPVMIYYNESAFVQGKMTINLFNGELERLIGFIEQTCFTGFNSTYTIFLNYPTSLEEKGGQNYICMKFHDKKDCQMLACSKKMLFSGVSVPGNCMIQSRNENDVLRIII